MSIDLPRFTPTTLHLLANAVANSPDHSALVCDGHSLTYRQFGAAVQGLAAQFEAAGARGNRIATLLGNSFEIAVTWFAAQLAGAQLAPLNPLYTATELGLILSDCEPHVVIVGPGILPDVLAQTRQHAACPPRILSQADVLSLAEGAVQSGSWTLPDPQSLVLLQYTGGTSGKPKGVNQQHRALAINIAQREQRLPTSTGAERILAVTPLYHSYASNMGLNLAVACASTLVIASRFDPTQTLKILERERITLFAGSPTIFNLLLSEPAFGATDFSHLRLCYSGSAALPSATLEHWESTTGCIVCEGYGQTESGPVLTYNPASGVRKPGSVGTALANTEIQIVDAEHGTRQLPVGTAGEIRARGPQIMIGYRNRPEETAQALRHGWLYTGDIGRFDDDGYLTICDRKKDMVIVSGFNVYPREVEEVLHTHPNIVEAGVVGRLDQRQGEALVAWIVRSDPQLNSKAVRDFLRQHLTGYKVPREFQFVDALPKTAVGKTDKVQLRQMAESQKPDPE